MMPDVLVYLLKANAALLLLLGLYYALLRRLTFHQLNRAYLLGAGAFSLFYPLLDVSALLVRPVQLSAVALPEWALLVGDGTAKAMPAAAAGPDYGLWLLGLYWAGVAFMLLRLLLQGASLAGVHRASRPAMAAGVPFRQVAAEVNPFSFWQTIYLNPDQHGATELPAILLHEQVHVRQWHTLDVLLAHLQRIMGWFSPGTWLLLRAVQENLEFITDEEVLRAGRLDARQYQYSLVRLSTLAPGPALVTPFSFITLKNRIRMMNSPASARKQAARYLLALPLALGLLSFSAPEAASAMLTPTVAAAPAGEDIEKPTTISHLPPAALAHIVKEYPGYRLIGVSELRAPDGSNLRYKAEIAVGRRPKQLVFTEKGEPVAAVAAPEPLYYVDGKLMPKSEVDKLDPKTISSMNVLKGETARKTFGDKAIHGVIVIITKENINSAEVQRFIKKHSITFNQTNPEDEQILNSIAEGRGVPAAVLRGKLLIINDQEATAEQATMGKEKIEMVLLMDAEQATKKYGQKGRQGAIIIKTK
ncbi:M56 family metallopeptidase [Hymenobacter sp. DG25B]|uniref:M56 family metallopeptidase n=1 Tax=Hymenobacter sp. DG25B TaxID=1385664 RepID=UPI00066255F1|nr:M56 family metallopeptidase [Hymenobacter sp. DG25B]